MASFGRINEPSQKFHFIVYGFIDLNGFNQIKDFQKTKEYSNFWFFLISTSSDLFSLLIGTAIFLLKQAWFLAPSFK